MASKKGFTLIDLLVTIAIMSLLSAIIMASLAQARVKAQNAVRQSDFNQLQKALELYYADHEFYPFDAKYVQENSGTVSSWNSLTNAFVTALQPLVDGGYISRIPIDPLNTASNYYEYKTGSLYNTTTGTPLWKCNNNNPGPYILSIKSVNNPITGIPQRKKHDPVKPDADAEGFVIDTGSYCVTVENY